MSADLFEAFVGSESVKKDSKQADQKHSSQLLDISLSEDTWQPWPAETSPTSQWPPEQQSQSLWETDQDGRDVLFDAGQLDTEPGLLDPDDDFGAFEDATTKEPEKSVAQIASLSTTVDLLDLENAETESGHFTEIVSNQSAQLKPSTKHTGASSDSTKPISREQIPIHVADLDDDWGDFETTSTTNTSINQIYEHETSPAVSAVNQTRPQPSRTQTKQQNKISPVTLDIRPEPSESDTLEEEPWDDSESGETANAIPSSVTTNHPTAPGASQTVPPTEQRSRPTNVPPPAVLLAWLPKVFSKLAAQSRQPNADPACGTAAIQAYRASARIIAGKAARWKRDTILAQSMRIGAAGRSGGMKLAALDKGESRKEDQAAEDVITLWTRYSHVLNAAIARAKAQKPPMALSLKLTARVATGLDVVSATHVCVLCGLRRNERVTGIDMNVSDTFGEFWVEHLGHKDCTGTWYAFNELLDQR